MSSLIPLKLARPREIPLLKMAGYEVIGPWDASFTMMRLSSRETIDAVQKAMEAEAK